MKKSKNPVCAILWQDAAYSNSKKTPVSTPPLTLTTGFIIKSNKNFTQIATSVSYSKKKIIPKDGFLIPNDAIVDFRKIDFYD